MVIVSNMMSFSLLFGLFSNNGQIDTDPNFDYYLLKFGNKERSLAELEQTYYEMALEAGINMMESRLEHDLLTKTGLANVTDEMKKELIVRFLLAKMRNNL